LGRADQMLEDAITFAGSGAMYTMMLLTLCQKWLGDTDSAIAHGLLAGQGGMESAEAGLDQWRLATLAHGYAEVERILIESGDFRSARAKLAQAVGGAEFLAAWESFMERHGHHARGEIEFANPRWREMPDALL